MSTVLVVDDDPHILRTLEIMLEDDGYDVVTSKSGEDALDKLEKQSVNIALVDLQLPGICGTDVLRRIRDKHCNIETVIITAHGSIESAVDAMKEGAFDYVTKPFSPNRVRHILRQIERVRMLQSEVEGLKRRVGEMPFSAEFITQNPATLHLLEVAREVAMSDVTVLIAGESGTGKSLLAKLIHAASGRSRGEFVTVDCTSFQESLLESELFGHKRGSFTGAVSDKSGKVEAAHGGTLFLDEVGEVPLHLQGKLLRLVEDRTYECVGDPTARTVDARIIAATNRDLEDMVGEKVFRKDLFYRISVVDLSIPPLRNRSEDILLLADHFTDAFSRSYNRKVTGWDDEVERSFLRYSWPGNVRELAHAIERAILLCLGRTIRMEHLPQRLTDERKAGSNGEELLSLSEIEERQIRRTLAMGLPLEETARLLGIDPSTLWRKRKKYNI